MTGFKYRTEEEEEVEKRRKVKEQSTVHTYRIRYRFD